MSGARTGCDAGGNNSSSPQAAGSVPAVASTDIGVEPLVNVEAEGDAVVVSDAYGDSAMSPAADCNVSASSSSNGMALCEGDAAVPIVSDVARLQTDAYGGAAEGDTMEAAVVPDWLEYEDDDGDVIRFELQEGQLIKFVNGRRQCGDEDLTGLVTELRWTPRSGWGGNIFDQHGWGGGIPEPQLEPLRVLANRVGVEHSIPDPEEAARIRAREGNGGNRRRLSLRRRLMGVLRNNIEEFVENINARGDSSDDAEDGDGSDADVAEENDEPDGDEDGHATAEVNVRVDDGSSTSEEHSDADIPAFREQLAAGDAAALTLWRATIFRGATSLTGECALAVGNWVKNGIVKPADLQDEMILCIIRCLERGYAMFEEEEDLIKVFTSAVELTDSEECVHRMLERGALRAMIRGLQSSAHLLLDLAEDKDWFECQSLVHIYKAFKKLWLVLCGKPEDNPDRRQILQLTFAALGKWLRAVPLEDVWMGEDDILVFWVLIPVWPDYLDHLETTPHERSAEERARFKEICNWVLWPNDPVVESGYRLIGHLDLDEDNDFSLKFLLSEKFRWIVTPATKQRYLQYRVSQVAAQLHAASASSSNANGDEVPSGIQLVVHRETPLQDLCHQLGVSGFNSSPVNLLGGITVHFRGDSGQPEDGVDEGGPWREAIPLAFSELCSPNHGLFEVKEDGDLRYVEPRWRAPALVPDFQAQFELCGVLIGMALVYQAYAPTHFSRCFLKHLLGLKCVAEDVPSLLEQVKAIRDAGKGVEDFCLTFSVDDASTGHTSELRPGGADMAVCANNVEDYIRLRTEWEVSGRFESIISHVLVGLHRIVPEAIVQSFSRMLSADELDTMLAGHGISIQDWKQHTEYYGYEEDSDIVKWFWEAVASFTGQEREDLWTFISGSKGVPPGGFGHLTNAAGEGIRFTIAKVEASPEHLPVAHTCGYQLDLAQYTSAEELTNKLKQAMSHRQGFGLA